MRVLSLFINRPMLLMVSGVLLLPAPAGAGRTFLGFHGAGSRLAGTELPPGTPEAALRVKPAGGGADLQIGYGLAPTVLLRLSLGGSEHESNVPGTRFTDGHLLLEIDRVWNASENVRPYLLAGLGGFLLQPSDSRPDIQVAGIAATAGAGLMLQLSRRFAFDLNGRAEFINWSEERSVTRNPDGSTVTTDSPVARRGHGGRLSIGLLWWL